VIDPGRDTKPDTTRPARRSLPYLPGLDGLRAIAVLAVLLYHADLPGLDGGFLGVEVFFVISGYLITSLLLAEWQDTGTLHLGRFWLRRARRLLPALFALLAVVAAYAAVRLPHTLAALRGDVEAALGYVTNWYLIARQESYFEVMGRPSLLKHLWSLAVEEQFYIVWPVLTLVALRVLRRRGFLLAVLVGIAGSAALMWSLYVPGSDPTRVYYGTDTRAAGLLAGAALACVWSPWGRGRQLSPARRIGVDAAGVLALLGVAGALVWLGEADPVLYRGGFVAVDVLTVILIAAVVHPLGRIGRMLGVAPLRWVGLRSYGIYLWHWPVFMITRPWVDLAMDAPAVLVYRLVLTAVLAEVSYRWIELPLRRGDPRRALQTLRQRTALRAGARAAARGTATLAAHLAVVVLLALPLAGLTPLSVPWSLSVARASAADAIDGSPTATAEMTGTVVAATPSPEAATVTPDAPEDAVDIAGRPLSLDDPIVAAGGAVITPAARATTVPLTATVRAAFVGDSVMVGAAPALQELFGPTARIDAAIRRQFSAGLDATRTLVGSGRSFDVVVIHLGSNGPLKDTDLDALMGGLRNVPYVFLLTAKVPRHWEESVNTALAAGAAHWPNATIIDWRAASMHHPELFMDDGIHLMPEGRTFYARLVLDAVTARLESDPQTAPRSTWTEPSDGVARVPQDATT
jgi:peptidoglycan/LPS O-acetylase OafA/YrhL